MKRTIAFVLMVVMIAVLSCSALADEITFRNIPWGCTAAEFLKEMKVDLRVIDSSRLEYWSKWNFSGWSSSQITEYETGFHLYEWGEDDINLKVAGYNVLEIEAHFIYSETEDGHLDRNTNAGRFQKVSYTFKFEDVESAYQDLKEKLTKVYGEGSVENESSFLWTGDNNTQVRLVWSNDPNNDYHFISIRYGKADMDEDLAHVDELARKEQVEAEQQNRLDNTDNTDGL